jgi:hypothetical protein
LSLPDAKSWIRAVNNLSCFSKAAISVQRQCVQKLLVFIVVRFCYRVGSIIAIAVSEKHYIIPTWQTQGPI